MPRLSAFSRVWDSGNSGSFVEWTRIEEDPEAESIWVGVVPRANMSLGCAEDGFFSDRPLFMEGLSYIP